MNESWSPSCHEKLQCMILMSKSAYLKLSRMIRAVVSVKRDKEYPTVYTILKLTISCLTHSCKDESNSKLANSSINYTFIYIQTNKVQWSVTVEFHTWWSWKKHSVVQWTLHKGKLDTWFGCHTSWDTTSFSSSHCVMSLHTCPLLSFSQWPSEPHRRRTTPWDTRGETIISSICLWDSE